MSDEDSFLVATPMRQEFKSAGGPFFKVNKLNS